MGKQLYPRSRHIRDKSGRPWHVAYDLAYDGGSSQWTGYYRTLKGAHFAAWWNVHIRSWGGSAYLFDKKE